jgi:hypothetical protein
MPESLAGVSSFRMSALARSNATTAPTTSRASGARRRFGVLTARPMNCSSKGLPQRGQRVATGKAFWPHWEQVV